MHDAGQLFSLSGRFLFIAGVAAFVLLGIGGCLIRRWS